MDFLYTRLLRFSAFRYLLTGATLFVLDLVIFLLSVNVAGLDIWLGQIISRSAGASAGFLGHKYFSFARGRTNDNATTLALQGGAYLLVAVLNIVISPVVVQAAVGATDRHLIAAKILAEIFLVAETYFLLRVVFVRHDTKTKSS